MFIDSHCHLDFAVFDKNRQNLITECGKLGIKSFINPATKSSCWDKLLTIRKHFANVYVCFGLHPAFIDLHQNYDIKKLEEYTQSTKTKLIGEIGLDKRVQNFDKQLDFFKSQINVAKNLNKKVIIHSVKSHNEIIKIIKDTNFNNGGIIHAFNTNTDIAKTYIDLGFKLGIGGIISHPYSKLKQTLKSIDSKNIVLETDSPDMQLYAERQITNTPKNIPRIFELVSNVYELNPAILKQQIYNTSLEFI
ncbi:TatD family hydrolase [Allofrancisella guangzhouensis]|uniref:DNAase n=1 Tax=Allofrancisella guangzhouensis TaxID=594679 RepID=A0A0A8E455_9GAMM|nr:TatD family hydrolase [Allofrancisella guangzhouensis]AJC48990.1 DNAase [Allofrancisella guangzhouensis]MBK2027895.1 TatD family hydrolase [Allofrancisella guangzhouensis]MBK2044148.1 TatD family hydrolase [Allofrancisella guangzhouensis]MBK2045128.1 TatD family hydrolase [Allofrancisella guangzhouensis]